MILSKENKQTSDQSSGFFTCVAPTIALGLTLSVLSNCHFIDLEAIAKYSYCSNHPLVYHPTENVVHVSLGLTRISGVHETKEGPSIELSSDVFLKASLVFAILPILSGLLTFLLLIYFYKPEVGDRSKISLWCSVIYALNALFVLLALACLLATNLCNGDICPEKYDCFYETDDLEYCVEECSLGTGAALASVASCLWIVSGIGAFRSFLAIRHQEHCIAEDNAGDLGLDLLSESPLML